MRSTRLESSAPRPPRRSALRLGLDLFSSVRLGMTMLALLLVYMSVGSAIPPLRQHPFFDMTEFEWFNWWPFTLLVALVCLNIIVVTLRRIPFNRFNLGVWMVHTGLICLALSSTWYFTTKVEGDAPVIRRQVTIHTPDGRTGTLVALPGARARLGGHSFEIIEINPQWPLLTAGHEGESAYSVSVRVSTPERTFIRQLLDGHAEFTEDILPGRGRAVNITGDRLIDTDLRLTLDPHPQDHYFLAHSRALYIREAKPWGGADIDHHDDSLANWTMRDIHDLPRYNDVVGAIDDVWPPEYGDRLSRRGLGIEAAPTPHDPFPDVRLRITGFLRYAHIEPRWVAGADRLFPTLEVEARSRAAGATRRFRLFAHEPHHSATPGGEIRFAWIEREDELAAELQSTTNPVTLVGGPEENRLRAIVAQGGAPPLLIEVAPGEDFSVGADVELRIVSFAARAIREERPAITPHRRREREAGEHYSMILVEVETDSQIAPTIEDDGRWHDESITAWLPYNSHVFDSPNYAYSGRFMHNPVRIDLPDGRSIELLFARERRPLPAPIMLNDFTLTTRIGGYTGRISSIRDWTSDVSFLTASGFTDSVRISTNDPGAMLGLWFFQASWDPPQSMPGPDGFSTTMSAGLNYTGLGVGNRNGVHAMLASCMLIVCGMGYAFYIKPILKRRRSEQVHRSLRAQVETESPASVVTRVGVRFDTPVEAGAPS